MSLLERWFLTKDDRPTRFQQTQTMSSRALKRLEKQKLQSQDKGSVPQSNEVTEENEEEFVQPKPKFNAFALLNEGEASEESDSEEPEIEPATTPEFSKKVGESDSAPISNNKSKSKRKNKDRPKPNTDLDSDEELDRILAEVKKKDKSAEAKILSAPVTTKAAAEVEEDEEYDFEEEYDLQPTPIEEYDSNFKFFTSKRLKQSLPLLSIKSPKKLDPDQEFRSLLGNLSLETIEDGNNMSSLAISPEALQQFKRMARLTRGWSGKDRRGVPGSTRKLILSRIRDDWLPTAQKPMNMEEIPRADVVKYLDYKEDDVSLEELELKVKRELRLGVKYFRFCKISSPQDRMADTRFYAAVVMTPDPDSLIQLLRQYTYHAEALIQMAMVTLRQGNEKAASNSLIEKALFMFDRSFHKNLHDLLNEGKSQLIRLPYESYMNRQFYLCLFRYITGLGERRLFVTALSYCKLLLGLSPAEDPMGVRYFIDYYAIMSGEYKYLTDLAKSPLFTTYKKWFTPGVAFSTALAYLYLDDRESASEALKLAYENHPYTAMKLLEVVGLGELTNGSLTEKTTEEEVSCETYLVRASIMWNDESKRQFLHDGLSKLFEEEPPQSSKTIKSSIYKMLGYNSESTSKDVPINLIRFAIVSGENTILARLPEQVWALDNLFEYDVLPPRDTKVAYNEFTGMSADAHSITDSLINYIDHNLLGNLVVETGRANDFNAEDVFQEDAQ